MGTGNALDITPKDHNAILSQMAKTPYSSIHKGIGQLLLNRTISPQEAVVALSKIKKAKESRQKELLNPPKPEEPKIAETKAEEKPSANTQPKEEGKSAIKPVSKDIHIDPRFNTLNYGQLADGKTEETPERKKGVEQAIRNWNQPIGKDGESFEQLLKRSIPAAKSVIDKEPHNTTIVTNSSVLKGLKVWDNMGRPDINSLTPEQQKQFSDNYNDEKVKTGEVETMDKPNKSDGSINVVRHGQTEDNVKGVFRNRETTLTDKGEEQAYRAGKDIKAKIGNGPVPKIISSDLPRTIHTANIIHSVLSGNEKLNPGSKVQVNDKSDPSEGAKALQGSYDRLIKSGADPDDSDMKRMAWKIQTLQGKSGKPDYGHIIGQADPREVAALRKGANKDSIEHFLKHLHSKGAIKYDA